MAILEAKLRLSLLDNEWSEKPTEEVYFKKRSYLDLVDSMELDKLLHNEAMKI